MRQILFALAFPFFLYNPATPEKTYDIEIKVQGLKNPVGKMSLCLMNNEEQFLDECFQGSHEPIESESFTYTFENVPAGDYAISLFHDEDENGELNMGRFIPIPAEKYGFSNNPSKMFGPPKYENCLFTVNKDITLTIEL